MKATSRLIDAVLRFTQSSSEVATSRKIEENEQQVATGIMA